MEQLKPFYSDHWNSTRKKTSPTGLERKMNRCTDSLGAVARSVIQPEFWCGPISSHGTTKMVIKWQSSCSTHRAHSTAKALCVIAQRYSHWAPWFHRFNATIYSTIFKRTIYSIWTCSPNMDGLRSKTQEKRHSSACNSLYAIGVFRTKPNMVRSVVNVYYSGALKYQQNRHRNCNHCENKSHHASPKLLAIWCHIRVLLSPVIQHSMADYGTLRLNSKLVSNRWCQCCLHRRIWLSNKLTVNECMPAIWFNTLNHTWRFTRATKCQNQKVFYWYVRHDTFSVHVLMNSVWFCLGHSRSQ